MIKQGRPPSRHRQSGAVLLAVMMLLASVLAYTVVSRMSLSNAQMEREKLSMQALTEAKAALIGRAVSDGNRPGSLPCPADDPDDGVAELLSGDVCPSYIGFLPWYTLKLNEPKDGWNAPLLYALSPEFRDDDSAQPINSETSGALTVDSTSDVVAVIFAPGRPLTGQSGSGSVDVDDYLEGTNTDSDDDKIYTAIKSDTLNDSLIFITRKELMRAVEQRVLGEAEKILRDYLAEHGQYPWLSPFSDPSSSDFTASPDVRFGHLPYTVPGEAFKTEFQIVWGDVPGTEISATILPAGLAKGTTKWPTRQRLKNNDGQSADGTCTWNRGDEGGELQCSGSSQDTYWSGSRTQDFSFEFTFKYDDDFSFPDKRTFDPATADTVARYDLVLDATNIEVVNIEVTDTETSTGDELCTGTASVRLSDGATLSITGIRRNLDEEVPEWFIKNKWHHLIFAAISENIVPGAAGGGSDLTLTVNSTGASSTDKQVLLLIAGADLSGNRPSDTLSDYLDTLDPSNLNPLLDPSLTDYDNADGDGDDSFITSPVSSIFNDQIRVFKP